MRLSLLFIIIANNYLAQIWSRISDFPGSKRDDGVAVTVNNKAYFGTGLQEGWSATIDFFELNLSTNTWTTIPNMPHTTERQYACAFAGNNSFYVFGGVGPTGVLNNMYKYSVLSRSWTQVNSKPGAGLSGAACLPFGDRVIIAGGKKQPNGSISDEVWEYQISTDSWVQKNNLPFRGRWRSSATVLHGFGYLIFGIDSLNSFRKELYRYNPNNDSWTKVSDFPATNGRAYAAMAGISEKLFVFGGYDSTNTYYNDVWYYNDILNTWSADNSLPSFGRKGGMYVLAGNSFYYTCGINKDDKRLNETWLTDVPLAIKKQEETTGLKIYPNPCNDFLFIEQTEPVIAKLGVFDINGNALVIFANLSERTIKLNLSDLKKGIYLINAETKEGNLVVKKVVKD